MGLKGSGGFPCIDLFFLQIAHANLWMMQHFFASVVGYLECCTSPHVPGVWEIISCAFRKANMYFNLKYDFCTNFNDLFFQ